MLAAAEAFVARWGQAGSAERSNAQPFLIELCDLIGVERPPPATGGDGGPYRFERNVSHYDADERVSTRRMDLYKRDCFILEAKQGANVASQPELFALVPQATRRQRSATRQAGCSTCFAPRGRRSATFATCRPTKQRRRS